MTQSGEQTPIVQMIPVPFVYVFVSFCHLKVARTMVSTCLAPL